MATRVSNATHADLFNPPGDRIVHAGGFDEAPWYIQRFIRSICDMRQPWMITGPMPEIEESDDDQDHIRQER